VIGAMRSSDREGFANLFARSIILFLQLPPDSENGLDPKVLQEELLASIRTSARDLAHREKFSTLGGVRAVASLSCCSRSRPGRGVCSSPRQHGQRMMRFEVLGIEGRTAVRRFDGADSVVFNALTRYEYELPAEDFDLLSKAVPRAVADQQ
jgi:hypothetical protein